MILASFTNRGPVGSNEDMWSQSFFGVNRQRPPLLREVSYGQLTLTPAQEGFGRANNGVVGWLNLGYPTPTPRATPAMPIAVSPATPSSPPRPTLTTPPTMPTMTGASPPPSCMSSSSSPATRPATAERIQYRCGHSVWGHQWSLYGSVPAPTVAGVVVGGDPDGGYTEFGEWHCRSGETPGHMATIGIMVHEMGHDINWPDLYDTDGSSYGVGVWSIMGSGSWRYVAPGYAGSTPSHPDAFLKWYQGWLVPEQIVGTAGSVSLSQIETTQRAVQLLNNPGGVDWSFNQHSGTGEYFLLENRQTYGYDAGLPGCGLLIWHIDETRTATNAANATDSRRLVSLDAGRWSQPTGNVTNLATPVTPAIRIRAAPATADSMIRPTPTADSTAARPAAPASRRSAPVRR